MRLQELAFILTDSCNFQCAYCLQRRGTRRLGIAAGAMAARFFRRFLAKEASVDFYGGEPLLNFPVLRSIVEGLERNPRPRREKIHYVMTTNGSLLSREKLQFLEKHRFSISLSFDGLAQDIQRRPGSYLPTVALIREILARPSLRLEINSVFTARTVRLLRRSVEEMMALGVETVNLSFPPKPAWSTRSRAVLKDELAALRPAGLSFFRTHGDFPVADFRGRTPVPGLFTCFAGHDRLAVAPDETVWGCYQIYDYSRLAGDEVSGRFAFGDLASLIANPRKLERRLAGAVEGPDQMDLSTPRSPCFFCPDLGECAICPWSAALESGAFGLVAEDTCRIAKLLRNERRKVQAACASISRASRRDAAGHP